MLVSEPYTHGTADQLQHHEELVEMVHPFQAGALGSLVRVLAQNPQHAHQLPNSFEVLFGL